MLAQIQAMFAVVDLGKINWNSDFRKISGNCDEYHRKSHSIIFDHCNWI